jgi:hypothetical protein
MQKAGATFIEKPHAAVCCQHQTQEQIISRQLTGTKVETLLNKLPLVQTLSMHCNSHNGRNFLFLRRNNYCCYQAKQRFNTDTIGLMLLAS